MGGQICVGVRRSDGREYWTSRWTNPQQWIMTEPSFQEEGERLEKYLSDELFADGDSPDLLEAPDPVPEYGYILVDFKTKQIFSRNKYTSFGRLLILAGDGIEHAKLLQDLGWVTKVMKHRFHSEREEGEDVFQPSSFEEMVDCLENEKDGMFEVWWEGILKVVSHEGDDRLYGEALVWARENGWHMKTLKTPPLLS